ncbi:MAG: hypothetical protein IJ867_05890 [Clostridia bacterium]|nr:hypothetical protein [Clostridia bacterium]
MKKTLVLKIVVAVLIAITLLVAFSQNSFALHQDIGNRFVGTGDQSNATNEVAGLTGRVINITQVIAAGFAIIMLVVLGIRWMYAAPSGKAQIAKSSRYYILGAILIFAAVGLLQIVKTFTGAAINNNV